MLLTKLLFLLLIIICSFFYILYVWDFALVLLIVIISLPIVMFITTLIAKKSIHAQFALQSGSTEKNNNFMVQLCLTNNSIFAIGKAEAHIEYYNIFSDSISSFDIYMPIQPRNTQRVTFSLSSQYCGQVFVRSAYINIYDPLRLFRFRTCKGVTASLAVTPEIHEIDAAVAENCIIDEESEHFSENKPGDDPSEVFSLREYSPGDKLNRIHWKLSSKKDDFIVKDYSLPIDAPALIFVDLKCYEDSPSTLPVFDTIIETFASLSHFMISNERMHKLVYYNAVQGNFIQRLITDFESLTAAVNEMITSFSDNLYSGDPTAYLAEKSFGTISSFTLVSSEKDGKTSAFIADEISAEIKNALIIVPFADSRFTAPESGDNMKTIPVIAGHISASIKDIEL